MILEHHYMRVCGTCVYERERERERTGERDSSVWVGFPYFLFSREWGVELLIGKSRSSSGKPIGKAQRRHLQLPICCLSLTQEMIGSFDRDDHQEDHMYVRVCVCVCVCVCGMRVPWPHFSSLPKALRFTAMEISHHAEVRKDFTVVVSRSPGFTP